jgi:hypothetical protein
LSSLATKLLTRCPIWCTWSYRLLTDMTIAEISGFFKCGLHDRHVKDVRLALSRALARSHVYGDISNTIAAWITSYALSHIDMIFLNLRLKMFLYVPNQIRVACHILTATSWRSICYCSIQE